MSLEKDITAIRALFEFRIDEGFAHAKEIWVDSGKMPLAMLKRIASKDPTYPKTGKYIEWMAKQYHQHRNLRGFDIIAEFDKMLGISSSQIIRRDINQYTSLEDLRNEVDAARSRISEVREKYKEREVYYLLIRANGSVERAMRWAAGEGEVRTDAAGEEISDDEAARRASAMGRGSLVSDYGVTSAYVEKIRKKIEKEQKGIFGKDFTIDDDILTKVDPEDVTFGNNKVVAVSIEPQAMSAEWLNLLAKSEVEQTPELKEKLKQEAGELLAKIDAEVIRKSQLYGRGIDGQEASHCIAYLKRENQLFKGQSYFAKGGRFYFILPKDIQYVSNRKYTKVCVQVDPYYEKETEKDPVHMSVWDWNDNKMCETEWHELFRYWGIPIHKTDGE